MPARFEGLIAATFTPMQAGGEVSLERIPQVVQHLVDSGVHGLYVNGSTGEGESLTPDERLAVAEAFLHAARGRLPVVVQVGANSVRVAEQLAEHAARHGAAAVSATPPSFFKPRSVADLLACLAPIAEAAGDVPLYYYHVPVRSGVDLDVRELLRRADQGLPNLGGVKFSQPDICGFQACLETFAGRFELLWGCDELLLSGVASGARAAVGTTYCYAAPVYLRLLAACERGDWHTARLWQANAVRMVEAQLRHGGLPAFKATMAMVNVPCGPVRPPWADLDLLRERTLRAELEAMGFFRWLGC